MLLMPDDVFVEEQVWRKFQASVGGGVQHQFKAVPRPLQSVHPAGQLGTIRPWTPQEAKLMGKEVTAVQPERREPSLMLGIDRPVQGRRRFLKRKGGRHRLARPQPKPLICPGANGGTKTGNRSPVLHSSRYLNRAEPVSLPSFLPTLKHREHRACTRSLCWRAQQAVRTDRPRD